MSVSSRLGFPEPVQDLIESLRRLPSVGPRSAERMALWLLQEGRNRAFEDLQAALEQASVVSLCARCGFFVGADQRAVREASEELADEPAGQTSAVADCLACNPELRLGEQLCVVEQPTEVLALERTGEFRGCYHCLGGKLAPLDDIGPENLRLESLWEQLASGRVKELILATSSDVEGEATASYLAQEVRKRGFAVQVSRPAQGLPAGGGLQGADQLTLIRALSGRQRVDVP